MGQVRRRRLDDELVAQGLFADRGQAGRAVMAGEVSLDGELMAHPGAPVPCGAPIHVRRSPRESACGKGVYASRGGLKLEGALQAFDLDPSGLNCLDVGCSSGGFTDCLLKFGADRVAAVDVGRGQFDWRLRGDARVALFERTNICDADPAALGAPFDLAVADVSFTSVGNVLASVEALLGPAGLLCTLVKPQFEAPRADVGAGGVVRSPEVHRRVLREVMARFGEGPLEPRALCPSPVHGAKGNIEYFLLAAPEGSGPAAGAAEADEAVRKAWEEARP